jgi:hypothetical protein
LQQELSAGASSSTAAVSAAAITQLAQTPQPNLDHPLCIVNVSTSQVLVPVVSTGDLQPNSTEAAAFRVTCTCSFPPSSRAAAAGAASSQDAAAMKLSWSAVLGEAGHADIIQQEQLHINLIQQQVKEAALTAPAGSSSSGAVNITSCYTADVHITPLSRALCGTTPKVCRAHRVLFN